MIFSPGDQISTDAHSLAGKLLMAMPSMNDPRFQKAVLLVCMHNHNGAMGIVLNRHLPDLKFSSLLEQLHITVSGLLTPRPIHYGGPMENGRGFVVHSLDNCNLENTLQLGDDLGITATVDILQAIAVNNAPRHVLIALGYAGWSPGQLEAEIQGNHWLHVEPDHRLVFDADLKNKWEHAIAKIGFAPDMLSGTAGHA